MTEVRSQPIQINNRPCQEAYYKREEHPDRFQTGEVISMQLSFLGAAGTVTGSKYLVTFRGFRLLVDCGLYQGLKDYRRRNWQPLPVPAEDIDAIVLTHAHIDHSGTCRLWSGRVMTGPSTVARAPGIYAGYFSLTPVTFRRKTPALPTNMVFPNTSPHCHCIPKKTLAVH